MDEQFFDDGDFQQADNATTENVQQGQTQQADPFQFSEQPASNTFNYTGSNASIEVDDEITKRIKEEEEAMQQKLREKAVSIVLIVELGI